ncbi:MAG TPA: glycosyltransferase family 4 protein [Tepidisphaeraceae bacterium]
MTHNAKQPAPLSVGLFTQGWPPEKMANGVTTYVATMARALRAAGVGCQVISAEQRDPAAKPDPLVHVLDRDNHSLLAKVMWRLRPEMWLHRSHGTALLGEVRRLHRERAIDLIEMEESFGWPRYLVGRCPVPLIVRLHGPWFLNGTANGAVEDAEFAKREQWERAAIEGADAITAPSRHVLDSVRRRYGIALPGAEVIPNPVEPVEAADRWNLQACDRNRIVFVGRFDRHKGGDTMIEAFARIARQRPDVHLDFIGPDRGCQEPDGRKITIEQYLRDKLGEAERARVTYHGFLPASAAAEFRKRALVTVAPSRYETFGIAAAEAMMAGCPLVVGAAGAQTDMIQDGQNGLTAVPGDPADLADKVLALLNDPAHAATLGQRAAADAAERYAPDRVARQTIEFYRRVLAGARRLAKSGSQKSAAPPRAASVSV